MNRPIAPRFLVAVVAVVTAAPMLPAAVAAAAPGQQVNERLRSEFGRADLLYRSADPEQAFGPLSRVILALEPAAERDDLDEEGRSLLIRSLSYRADINLVQGNRGAADADFERILRLYPRVTLDSFWLSDAAMDRFERARNNLIGTITLAVQPHNARLHIDGVQIPPGTTAFDVLAGDHVVGAFLPGFTQGYEEVSVRASRAADVTLTLHRVSAVVKLRTRPAGATVIVDGRVVGETGGVASRDWAPTGEAARYPRREFSSEIAIEGLMPGHHEVEVFLDGYRSFSAPLEVPDLADYLVGPVVLSRSLGIVILRDLSPEAEVWVDGRRTQPELSPRSAEDTGTPASNAYRLSLPPGQYRVTVSQGDAGVFEESVTLADRRNVTLTVRLRPGLSFLGVIGEDRLGAAALEETMTSAFADLGYWAFLDRSDEAPRILQRAGATAPGLRAAATPGSPSARIDWERVQSITSRELPGSVFVLGVLGAEELASEADLWVWPAAPGPPIPERVRVSLTNSSELEALARRLSSELSFTASWLGAELIDSMVVGAPVVAAVVPGSPAEDAGLQVGDQIMTVAGNSVGNVANAHDWFSTFNPGSTISIGLRGVDGNRTVEARLAAGPLIVAPSDPDLLFSVVWGMAAAGVGRMDTSVPSWAAELNQISVLMRAQEWDAAVRLLRNVQAPRGAGVGQGLVDYWLGVALHELGDDGGARSAFERVLAQPEARYLSNDGLFLAPMARARLFELSSR